MNNSFNLCSPWMAYFHEMEAFFKEDPDVKVTLDNDKHIIKVFVDDDDKAEALSVITPTEKVLGNITVKIEVVPANGKLSANATYDTEVLKRAFEGNGAIVDFEHYDFKGLEMDFVLCKPVVVQMKNDSIHNPKGLVSTLYENIAEDIFIQQPGIFFTTADMVESKKTAESHKVKFPKDEM